MGDEDDETYECLAGECERTFNSSHGRGIHVSHSHDMDKIIQNEIQQLANDLGRTPTKTEMDDQGRISSSAVEGNFGSWNNAIKKVGLPTTIERSTDLSKEDAISAIQKLADDLGRTPTGRDMSKYGSISRTAVNNRFGTWNNALQKAGLEINQKQRTDLSREDLISTIKKVAEKLDRTPTADDIRNEHECSEMPIVYRFGSWNDALRAAGFEPNRRCGESTNRIYYGSNWLRQRNTVVSRDDNSCRVCDKHSSKIETHSVHVHHITPARKFGAHKDDVDTDYEEMNDPSNLICLCPSCHASLEGKFQDATPDEFAELGREYLGIDEETVVEAEANTVQTEGEPLSVQISLPSTSD